MAAKKPGRIEQALHKAQTVLARYIKPGKKSAEATIEELLHVLGNARGMLATTRRGVVSRSGKPRRTTKRKASARKTSARRAATSRTTVSKRPRATTKRRVAASRSASSRKTRTRRAAKAG